MLQAATQRKNFLKTVLITIVVISDVKKGCFIYEQRRHWQDTVQPWENRYDGTIFMHYCQSPNEHQLDFIRYQCKLLCTTIFRKRAFSTPIKEPSIFGSKYHYSLRWSLASFGSPLFLLVLFFHARFITNNFSEMRSRIFMRRSVPPIIRMCV